MNLKPLGDRVVLRQLAAEEMTKSGIVLPGQNPKNKNRQDRILLNENAKSLVKMDSALADRFFRFIIK